VSEIWERVRFVVNSKSKRLKTGEAYNRKFRTLNVMDDCSRELLAIEVDTLLSSRRVIRALDKIIEQICKPVSIRTDNGPEFTSKDF